MHCKFSYFLPYQKSLPRVESSTTPLFGCLKHVYNLNQHVIEFLLYRGKNSIFVTRGYENLQNSIQLPTCPRHPGAPIKQEKTILFSELVDLDYLQSM